uniref:Putative apolipoprotein d/lipocalin n=1 Tax=Tabanus bromius TaxID=304241 RepID=A0A0K8TRK0_TABBR
MSKVFVSSAVLLILSTVANTNGHTYHTGSCPSVEPMSGFNMRDFLGVWYAIQKTSTASTCIIYNITVGDEPGQYKVQQLSQHFVLGLTPLRHEYTYTGVITVPDDDVPARMRVRFPLSVAGSASFTVFMSDFTTYAGIYTCQKIGFIHRRSATLLSRTRTLDKMYVDKMRTRLGAYGVDPFDLSIIEQRNCPNERSEGVNINIDEDTFSAQSVANVFRKAGEKIGDGVEVVVDTGKKLYNKFTNGTEDDRNARLITEPAVENDAEWIRI